MSKRLFASFSKYRNAVGKPAKHENAYTDLKPSAQASSESCQLVKVSKLWIAYKHASAGSLAILPVSTVGRVGDHVQVLNAHSTGVSDWEFSPFDPQQLITGSDSGEVKVWTVSGENEQITTQLLFTWSTGIGKPVEAIHHHPTARGITATASHDVVQIWDVSSGDQDSTLATPAYTLHHPNVVSSISWKADGTRLATTCKDAQLRVFDVRQQETPLQTGQGHSGNRPSRVVWLGEKDVLFTSGFNKMREKESAVWNANDLSKPLELKRMDSSSGLAFPLYDEDTSIVFLPSKGESTIRWLEIAESSPFMTEGAAFGAQGPVAGAALFPKELMDVMQTEVARILTVNANSLWPVNVNVPRRSYLDFHADLYPDTKSDSPGLEASEWLQGENKPVPKVSLDPGLAGKPEWARFSATSAPSTVSTTPGTLNSPSRQQASPSASHHGVAHVASSVHDSKVAQPSQIITEKMESLSTSSSRATSDHSLGSRGTSAAESIVSSSMNATAKSPVIPRVATQKTSKYRFLSFKPYHASEHFDNISGLSISTVPECNLIEVNAKFLALPLHGPGGRIGILKTTEPGRVGTKVPSLVCSSELHSFKFDPFNPNLLVTASDDAKIKGWLLPEEGLDRESDTTKPAWVLSASTMDKITLILFHPRAKDVLLSASMDRNDPTLRLWDLEAQTEKVTMKGHTDVIFSCDFNHLGTKIVSVCKDKKIRIWDALSGKLLKEGPGHDSLRSCRVLWLGESDLIASVGFGRGSQREILLFDANDLERGPIDSKKMDMSPGVLVPHYDADTSVLAVSARGDRVMKHYEILLGTRTDVEAGKSLFVDVASLELGSLQQDVAYLPKRYCDVRAIELARMYRLTYNSVEVIRVSVPRNKQAFFQDDLFPDTIDVETATMEADDFFSGAAADRALKKISLCPSDMTSLSQHNTDKPVTPPQGGNSLDKFLQGKQQAAEDDRKRLAMERMFETAKESKADRDTLVPETGVVDDDEWDD
ncbi:Coronin-7 [Mortierella alpina]|uniref:Coronin n=1 Tax=Mortierella alpina TaxID=64518 RepID=A0A9P6LW68_MORAP|nr:Coronin-7 [Mortierella alpina]